MAWTRTAGALTAICAFGGSGLAAAQEKTALSWVRLRGAEGCISVSELGRRVERLVGPVLASAVDAKISIEGHVAPKGAVFEASVIVADVAGTMLGRRVLTSPTGSCRALDEPLAFVIAVAIDPNAALAALPPEFASEADPAQELLDELRENPPDTAPREAASGPARKRPSPPVRRPIEPQRPGVELRLAVGAGLGLLGVDDPASFLNAQVVLAHGEWAYRVRASRWLSQLDPSGMVEIDLAQLDLAACPRLWHRVGWHFSLCGGAVAARLSAEPTTVAGEAPVRWVFGPMAGARLERTLGAGLFASLDVIVQSLWPRHRVVLEESGHTLPVYRIPAVMASSGLALEWRF